MEQITDTSGTTWTADGACLTVNKKDSCNVVISFVPDYSGSTLPNDRWAIACNQGHLEFASKPNLEAAAGSAIDHLLQWEQVQERTADASDVIASWVRG